MNNMRRRVMPLLLMFLFITTLYHCGPIGSEEDASSGLSADSFFLPGDEFGGIDSPPPISTFNPEMNNEDGVGEPMLAPPPSEPEVVPPLNVTAKLINYKISTNYWNANNNRREATPQVMIDKVARAFDLWKSVPNTNLDFQFAGLTDVSDLTIAQLPEDGTITIILDPNFDFNCEGVSGVGGYSGSIDDYKKGYVVLNTKAGLYAMKFNTLVHEIGHALGMRHGVSRASTMFCGTKGWWDYEVLAFSEQDRADLVALWNPALTYKIAGTVTSTTTQWVLVYAVEVSTGHTYSALSMNQGNFSIKISKPGEYKIMTKGYEPGAFDETVDVAPSWYVEGQASTNNPSLASVISVSDTNQYVQNIVVPLIETPPPFNFFWSVPDAFPKSFYDPATGTYIPYIYTTEEIADGGPSLARPGHTIKFRTQFNGSGVTSIEAFGTNPDYDIVSYDPVTRWVTIYVHEDATEGSRLLVARGTSGLTQFGDLGFHIMKSALPGYTPLTVQQQFSGGFDFSLMNTEYWMQ